jgi:hypothetical protein
MELRTTIKTEPSPVKITYDDRVMLIGSCFASAIGQQMEMGRLPVMINPAGTVFNPVSVCNTINDIIAGRIYSIDDLYCHEGTYLSLSHSTDFSSDDAEKVIEKINRKSKEASEFLVSTKLLFITFGTARVYRWRKSGQIVSNCHKIPAKEFNNELLTVRNITDQWINLLDRLKSQFPDLKIVFTISPVRHWKDGAHGNQVSKSVLFLAVENLLDHSMSLQYFPAYELLMDDLRDYRYYSDDMLHPSSSAIDYIWEAFCVSFMDNRTIAAWREVVKITSACNHRLNTRSMSKIKDFAARMLDQISDTETKIPSIDLSNERSYFTNLLSGY